MLKTNITHLIVTTLLLASGFLFSTASQADSHDSFNTVWRMPAGDLTLTFPSEGSYTINWGDGTSEEITSNNPTHPYDTADDYTVTATNTITRFNLDDNEENRGKLIDIQQWGTANWTSMSGAFRGASAMMMSASDSPNLDRVTDMSNMFLDASVFNQDIGDWNVARVTNMGGMFASVSASTSAFNQDIGGWNVDRVTDMSNMFLDASVFNQDIGGWNVASVETMDNTFAGASAFNQDLGSWNVARVTDMSDMFAGASDFNQDIGGWNVARVTNMFRMFDGATAFNQNLGPWYVDEAVNNDQGMLQTANPDYDGVNDLNVLILNFVAQNARLREQSPIYTLATGTAAEGTDNAIFTLASNAPIFTLGFNSGMAA
ncbi:MAG: BspA family leucine-rich repeat surface protein, partial [Methylococcales symbiont of Iophon sp. n. MRB-2018]